MEGRANTEKHHPCHLNPARDWGWRACCCGRGLRHCALADQGRTFPGSSSGSGKRIRGGDGRGGRCVPKRSLLGARKVWAKGNVIRLRSPCLKHVARRSASCGIGEHGRKQAGKDGLQGRTPVHVGQDARPRLRSRPRLRRLRKRSQCARRCPHYPLCCPRSRGALQPLQQCPNPPWLLHAAVEVRHAGPLGHRTP
jgi:hypothetical protein